jgi:hypothetical protein
MRPVAAERTRKHMGQGAAAPASGANNNGALSKPPNSTVDPRAPACPAPRPLLLAQEEECDKKKKTD